MIRALLCGGPSGTLLPPTLWDAPLAPGQLDESGASPGAGGIVAIDDTMSIRAVVRRTAPTLLARPGIGIHTTAQLLMTAGGNPERLRNDAAFAALCGVSPVQASSGQTHRHRLNRGGDRAANNALWTIANNRMIHDPRTREFAARRKAGGDSRNDTLRVLKRYIARETFALIRQALRHENPLQTAA